MELFCENSKPFFFQNSFIIDVSQDPTYASIYGFILLTFLVSGELFPRNCLKKFPSNLKDSGYSFVFRSFCSVKYVALGFLSVNVLLSIRHSCFCVIE